MADWNQYEATIRQRALREVLAEVEALKDRAQGFKDDRGQRRGYTRVLKLIQEKIDG